MTMTETTPRIYVASLADYNAGRLVGRWIAAAQDAESIQEEIDDMLANDAEPGAEEWAIHDYDDFHGLGTTLGEHPSLETVSHIATGLAIHGVPYAAYVSNIGSAYVDVDTFSDFEDAYQGEWSSVEDYAAELLDDALDRIPEDLRPYFDVAAYGRALVPGGDIWTADVPGGVLVFTNH